MSGHATGEEALPQEARLLRHRTQAALSQEDLTTREEEEEERGGEEEDEKKHKFPATAPFANGMRVQVLHGLGALQVEQMRRARQLTTNPADLNLEKYARRVGFDPVARRSPGFFCLKGKVVNPRRFAAVMRMPGTPITALHLHQCRVNPDTLVAAVRGQPALRRLHLSQTMLPPDQMRRLLEAVADTCSVRELMLWGTGTLWGSSGDVEGAAAALCDLVRGRPAQLRRLSLDGSTGGGPDLGDAGVARLVAAVTDAPPDLVALERLDLWDTGGGRGAAVAVARMLELPARLAPARLAAVSLRGNDTGDEGAIMVWRAMRSNGTVTRLSLGETGVTNAGLEGLAEALAENRTLVELDLDDNDIVAVPAVPVGGPLRRLKVRGNLNLVSPPYFLAAMDADGSASLAHCRTGRDQRQAAARVTRAAVRERTATVPDNTLTGAAHVPRAAGAAARERRRIELVHGHGGDALDAVRPRRGALRTEAPPDEDEMARAAAALTAGGDGGGEEEKEQKVAAAAAAAAAGEGEQEKQEQEPPALRPVPRKRGLPPPPLPVAGPVPGLRARAASVAGTRRSVLVYHQQCIDRVRPLSAVDLFGAYLALARDWSASVRETLPARRGGRAVVAELAVVVNASHLPVTVSLASCSSVVDTFPRGRTEMPPAGDALASAWTHAVAAGWTLSSKPGAAVACAGDAAESARRAAAAAASGGDDGGGACASWPALSRSVGAVLVMSPDKTRSVVSSAFTAEFESVPAREREEQLAEMADEEGYENAPVPAASRMLHVQPALGFRVTPLHSALSGYCHERVTVVMFLVEEDRSPTKRVHTYENQRWYPVSGWSRKLLPTDRKRWTDREGSVGLPKDSFRLAVNHRWAGDWRVMPDPADAKLVDSEGWVYALDFPRAWGAKSTTTCVRRRRWVRDMERLGSGASVRPA